MVANSFCPLCPSTTPFGLQIDDEERDFIEYDTSARQGTLSKVFNNAKNLGKRFLGLPLDPLEYEAQRTLEEEHPDDLDEHAVTPESRASFFSLLLFTWFNSIVAVGRRKPLFLRDLGRMLPQECPEPATDALERAWRHENRDPASHIPSFFRALWLTYRWRLLLTSLPRLWRLTSGVVGPLIVRNLIRVVENPSLYSPWEGAAWSLAIFADYMVGTVAFQHYCQQMSKGQISSKSAINALIYKKLLNLSAASKQSNINGKVMSLIGADTTRVMEMFWFAPFFWLTPGLAIISFCTVAWMMTLYAALCGFAVLIVFVPISAFMTKWIEKLREIQTELTDARVRTTTEIFHTMKTVKLYALEEHFAAAADEARKRELAAIRKMQLVTAITESVNDAIVPLMVLATIATYTLRGGILLPSSAFALIEVYQSLYWPFLNITVCLSATMEFLVSVRRIQDFLLLQEVPGLEHSEKVALGEIQMQDASCTWDFEETLHNITMHAPSGSLTCIVGTVGSGKSSLLNALLGEMRKTSGSILVRGRISYAPQTPFLLHATVRENILFGQPFDEDRYTRTIEACALQADFDVLLAGDMTVIGERGINLSGGQKARIAMARAVYSNADIVLLDDPLSAVDAHVGHKLFNDCIKVLLKNKTVLLVTHQLQYVTHGDQLVVMQNGAIQHSGTPDDLRRAGVDIASLIEKFNEELNKHVEEAAPEQQELDDDVIDEIRTSAGSAGIPLRLSAANALKISAGDASLIQQPSLLSDVHYKSELSKDQAEAMNSKANVTAKEERAKGAIGLSVYGFYFGHKLRWWIIGLVLVIIHRIFDLGLLAYLGKWSAQNSAALNHNMTGPAAPRTPVTPFTFIPIVEVPVEVIPSPSEDFSAVLGIFSSIAAVFMTHSAEGVAEASAAVTKAVVSASTKQFLVFFTIASFFIVLTQMIKSSLILIVCTWTGKVVYMEMFNKLIHAPMSFFDTTPKGRIAARCSSDTDAMDNRISEPLSSGISMLTALIGSLIITSFSVRMWILVFIPLGFLYYGVYNRVINTFRDLTRLEGTSKAPLNTIFSESLNGLFTLRAFGRQQVFIDDLMHKLDCFIRPYYYKGTCERWLSLRIATIGAATCSFFGLVGVFSTTLNPGLLAAAITMLLNNVDTIGDLIHGYAHLESYMNSVERIKQYTMIETERPQHIPEFAPPAKWPEYGSIKFSRVSFRYRPGLPLVLNDISLLIRPGEKIGVVGRTGAGKSSLLSALLSLSPIEAGQITIDDEDISKMGVGDLRSRLSIIPQDPVIFEGSIRHNIDPFGTHTDVEIWETLRRVHLANVINGLPEKLDSVLAEDGANFSLGQRQLICVGRALLKKSKILLLDEASSSIDLETDHLLQKTLRTEFSHCTTITIAHRLATIMDSDRVLVLDAGKVQEFEAPNVLLANQDSLFSLLHQQTQSSAQAAIQSAVVESIL